MHKKHVLISGADGYIALHAAEHLKKNGYKVTRATRSTNSDVEMEFSKPKAIADLKMSGIDAMIHTVTPNEMLYKSDPYSAISENAIGIHAALDFCVNNRIKDFIYISSFHIFGNKEGVLNEHIEGSPINDYGLSHYNAEQTVKMFDRANKLNTWIIRPSNLFGVPYDLKKFKRWNLIPFSFCLEAVDYNKITLLTPGTQYRNFVGIFDVCNKLQWLLENRPKERIIHANGKETMNVFQYASLVKKVAWDHFQMHIEIIKPENNELIRQFEFSSIFSEAELKPVMELEIFVKELLTVLISRSGKE
ncbi:NAD(P)-dependent oxidoreductase [Paenibacillus sp. KACC 21273]|uniref:NAD-dependent epimerase/dehydratase family protein n=1 Tax=Paenibacillus sp. KACC 21273 TaxID=3025665 RepID=UPI0023652666|nr:NAD(P)-dependent oxidoreductase [Paenibacillus sp. KACC 21273]WDF51488.1 NAD(P)-dependent oxidoreductase [Paenibacillus sp. KACC 21273]